MSRLQSELQSIIGEFHIAKGRANYPFTVVRGGKRYQSDKLEIVAEFSPVTSDYKGYTEELYRSPKGAFLLLGQGEALSHWGIIGPNQEYWTGHSFVALSRDQARQWLEFRQLDAALDEIFGAEIEAA